MTPLATILDRLFGLEKLSFSQPGAALGWRYPLPLWVWVLIAAAATAAAVLSYRRLLGPQPLRAALGALRAVLLLVLAALLAGPLLVLSSERVEPDTLVVLIDRSGSMQMEDHPAVTAPGPGGDAAAGGALTRDAALREALARHAALFGPQGLARDRQVLWLGFAGGAFPLGAAATDPASLQLPDGRATALRTALEQALQLTSGKPVAGVVLFTDGRSPQATGGDLVRRLQHQAVSVFPVPLGAAEPPLDFAIAQLDIPDKAFVNDAVPVTVWVEVSGAADRAALDPTQVKVRLVDTATNQTLDETDLAERGLSRSVQLTGRSGSVGKSTWRVEVDAAGPARRELITSNNQRDAVVQVIDRPIRVLLVEGYPRWEYRYLKNMLIREQSILGSTMLISADREFAQEGDVPIARLPMTAAEFEPYDVVIVGDVPPTYFSPEQVMLLRDHVARRGAGLLWIGGARDTPRSYEGTPLADLLPMRRPGAVDRVPPSLGGLVVSPTPAAEALSILRLIDPADRDAAAPWPAALPPLQWAQAIAPLKQVAEVLAVARPTSTPVADDDTIPLVVRMRYGAGQSLYVATDDTFRWRYGRGELYFEQFWVQLVRTLARGRLARDDTPLRLTASSRGVGVDQPVVIELVVDDPALQVPTGTPVSVAVRRAGGHAEGRDPEPVDRIDLIPVPVEGAADAHGDGANPPPAERRYRATWRPRDSGSFELALTGAPFQGLAPAIPLDVLAPDDELRQVLTDHARLATLAEQTGGQVVPLDQLDQLAELVPNRARKTANDQREPLWDSYVSLFVVLFLLTAEWVGRRLIRLA